jgi:hypothetical protein
MKKLSRGLLGLSLAIGFAGAAKAQDKAATMSGPPKVLTVSREFVKPGKTGEVHDRAESAFVKAMSNAKSPTHYLGLDSLSGKLRSLFLTGYDSFEAWEKDMQAQQTDVALSSALSRAYVADAPLLDSVDQSVWVYREDQSMNPTTDIGSARFMEFQVFHIKPGHDADWSAGVKLVKDAYVKGVPDAHWDMYELVYGGSSSYVVITPMKSAAEIDKNFASGKQFMDAMGADGMRKLNDLSAAAIESVESNLFSINPHMSYVPDDVANSAPDFWRPKVNATPAGKPKSAKPEAKPATP